jgi:DNA-directed RNA polymerase subunit M/transcription elongation factor TFIIS
MAKSMGTATQKEEVKVKEVVEVVETVAEVTEMVDAVETKPITIIKRNDVISCPICKNTATNYLSANSVKFGENELNMGVSMNCPMCGANFEIYMEFDYAGVKLK